MFYQKEAKLAIVGDVLFQGSIGRTDFPSSPSHACSRGRIAQFGHFEPVLALDHQRILLTLLYELNLYLEYSLDFDIGLLLQCVG